MKSLFQSVKFKSFDPNYEFYLTCENRKDVCRFIDQMKNELSAVIGDTDLEDKIQTDFFGVAWQLYVGYALLKNSSIPLMKSKPRGPDYILEDGTVVEAVVANRGNGPDKPFDWSDVKPTSDNDGLKLYSVRSMPFPDPQITLRITNAIACKKVQHQKWVDDGIVRRDQALIVAVNAGLLDEAKMSPDYSYGARTAFALGENVFVVPVNDTKNGFEKDLSYSKINPRPLVKKKSGGEVQNDLFLNSANSSISGLIYSHHHIANVEMLGLFKDLELIENGFAKKPVPSGFMGDVDRTWAEIDSHRSEYIVRSSQLERHAKQNKSNEG